MSIFNTPFNQFKKWLSKAQAANSNIKGVAGADLNGGIYDAAGNRVSTGGGAYPVYIGPITSRSGFPDSFSNNTSTKYMRCCAVLPTTDRSNVIKPVFAVQPGTGTTEGALGAGTFTVKGFVTNNKGESGWLSFGGVEGAVGVGNYGDRLIPDEIEYPFETEAGSFVKVTFDIAFFPTSSNYPYYQDGLNFKFPGTGERCIISSTPFTNELTLGQVIDTSGGGAVTALFSYRPLCVLGKTTRETVLLDGDSINRGNANYNVNHLVDRRGFNGLLSTFLGLAGIGHINVSMSGDDYFSASQAGRYAKRGAYAEFVKTLLLAKSINDWGPSATLTTAQMNTYINAVLAQIPDSSSKRVFVATLLSRALNAPFTTSAHVIAYLTNQQTAANNSAKAAYNRDVRNGAVVGDGFIECSRWDETAENSGLQKLPDNARTVSDGAVNSGSSSYSSATANFTEADTGGTIRVIGAGTAGADLTAFMTFVNATTVTLYNDAGAVAAGTTVSGATTYINSMNDSLDGLHRRGRGYHKIARAMIAAGEHLKLM